MPVIIQFVGIADANEEVNDKFDCICERLKFLRSPYFLESQMQIKKPMTSSIASAKEPFCFFSCVCVFRTCIRSCHTVHRFWVSQMYWVFLFVIEYWFGICNVGWFCWQFILLNRCGRIDDICDRLFEKFWHLSKTSAIRLTFVVRFCCCGTCKMACDTQTSAIPHFYICDTEL